MNAEPGNASTVAPLKISRRASIVCLTLLALALIFYFTNILHAFFPSKPAPQHGIDWRALTEPVIQDDYVGHYVESIEAAHFFRTSHRIWGYNVWFNAGYPSGIYQGVDNHWQFLFQLLFGWIHPAFAFNLSLITAFLTMPLVMLLAGRLFALRLRNLCFLGAVTCLLLVGFTPLVHFLAFGGISFAYCSFLSAASAGALYHALRTKTVVAYLLLSLLASLALFVHILAVYICIAFCVPVLLTGWFQTNRRDWCLLAGAGCVCVLTNLIWIVPFLQFTEWRGTSDDAFQTPAFFLRQSYTQNLPLIVLTAVFVHGLARAFRDRQFALVVRHVLTFAALFLIAFRGTQMGIGNIQPGRFVTPLGIFLVVAIAERFDKDLAGRSLAGVVLAVFLLTLPFSGPLRLRIGYGDSQSTVDSLFSIIRNTVPANSRLCLQDSEGHVYFKSHFPAYLPGNTGRAILGGPYWNPIEPLDSLQFFDDRMFGQKTKELSEKDLCRYLDLYNVSYLLVHSDHAKRAFKDFSNVLDSEFEVGQFRFYRYMNARPSFCYEGTGDVQADYDRIVVRHASPGGLTLKFHYLKTLQAVPETVKLSPVKLRDNDMPFIHVDNGDCTDFIIVNP